MGSTRLAPRNYWLLIGVFVMFFGLAMTGLRDRAAPFHPFQVISYTAQPPDACPLQEVEMTVNYNLVMPEHMTVNPIVPVKSWWVNAETQQQVDGGEGRLDLSELDRGTGQRYVSPILRAAPNTPGRWRLLSEVRVSGTVYGTDREDFFVTPAEDTLRVLEPAHPTCLALTGR